MQIIFEPSDVTICEVPPTPVAMIEHRGERATIPDTRQRFMAWRQAAGQGPETAPSYMVFRSEREPAIAADYAMDLCVEAPHPVAPNPQRYPGKTNNLEPAGLYLYRDWLPASGEEARDFPLYCRRRLAPIPGLAAHEVVVELFLPLK